MRIYAGIDEAGYGPLFGPLTIGRTVFAVEEGAEDVSSSTSDATPDLWKRLSKAICKTRSDKRGRIAVNDSKKLHTPAPGSDHKLRHLELGVLACAGLAGQRPECVRSWLDVLGEASHHALDGMPWYAPTDDHPWQALPTSCTAGEIAIARAMLIKAANDANVKLVDIGAAVVFEDQFNRMVAATRSKAATSFTFVARHIDTIWQRFGANHPTIVVDRQSGRTHYRELLELIVPACRMTVLDESDQVSAYCIAKGERAMTVRFEVDADARHLPVALASMISKYTRELLMARFQGWFSSRAPEVKPTAGYASDAKRFWREIEPMLPELAIEPTALRRMS